MTWTEAWADRVTGPCGRHQVSFLGRATFVQNKRAAGRPKDLADIDALTPGEGREVSLSPGTRLGQYEVDAQIGVGGMGEVYRATDTNLGRDVAIKVLPESLAQDPERLARFDREARTLAGLNHPNIAQIHGLKKSDGSIALVMELVEGPAGAGQLR